MKQLKTKNIIIFFIALAVLCIIATVIIMHNENDKNIVEVIQDGKVIEEIDLSKVAEEYSFTIYSSDGGYNTIRVRPGAICVSESDCPDKICVNEKWLYSKDMPIVCMPHKLMIKFKTTDEVDAVAD